jgi:hypothetical protein
MLADSFAICLTHFLKNNRDTLGIDIGGPHERSSPFKIIQIDCLKKTQTAPFNFGRKQIRI